MINITCSICSHNKAESHPVLFSIGSNPGETYQIRKCINCGNIYTYFDHDVEIDSYYDEKDYTVQDTRDTIFYKIQRIEYNLVLEQIRKFIPIPAGLLDFGSGKGLFLKFAREQGYEVKGIESSVPRANYAKSHFNLDINTNYYTTGSVFNTKFDILSMFHVLEHINISDNLLNNLVRDNLKDKGLLLIEVPNFNSWQSKWAGNKWLHLDVPRHLNHFTGENLQKVIERSGCVVKKTAYFSFHLGIVGMVQTIFGWFGYKGFLIAELKRKKTFSLMLGLLFVLPLAVLLESLAAGCKKGGVLRYYAIKKGDKVS